MERNYGNGRHKRDRKKSRHRKKDKVSSRQNIQKDKRECH